MLFDRNIDLKDTVKNNSGKAISGVAVTLLSSGSKDTTDAQGKFQISGATGIRQLLLPQQSLGTKSPVYILGKGVQFGQSSAGLVHLQVFDLAGKEKADIQVQLDAGIWEISPGKLNPGIYVAKLATQDAIHNFKFSIFNALVKTENIQSVQRGGTSVGLRKVAATVDSLMLEKPLYKTTVVKLSSLVDSAIVATLDTVTNSTNSALAGDIAAAAGTPLVAAHSIIRALYKSYNGKLFQVRRASDGKTQDITPATAGGSADLAAIKTFLTGTTGTVAMIYDQAGNGNDLPQAAAGSQMELQFWKSPSGIEVPMAVTPDKDKYYRNRMNTKKIPKGAESQSIYFVVYTKFYNAGCCWNYGNMQATATVKPSSANVAGMMNAVNIGTDNNGYSNKGAGTGPWGMVDYEAGVYSGSFRIGQINQNNPSLTWPIATVLSKTNGTTNWKLKVGDVTKGNLITAWDGALPPAGYGSYSPLKQEGGLSLGEGGDGSKKGSGAFFEGVVIAGVTSDVTDNAIQAGLTSYFK